MQKRTRTFLGGILLLVVIAAACAFYMVSKPHTNVADDKADVALTAETLYKNYLSNEADADKKYLNKVIEVTGKVGAHTNEANNHFILLKTNEYGGVNCQVMMDDTKAFDTLNKDALVTIKGRCTGFLMDVNLTDCVIIK